VRVVDRETFKHEVLMSRLPNATVIAAIPAMLLVFLIPLSCGRDADPTTYAEALAMAKEQQKPLLIDFYAEG